VGSSFWHRTFGETRKVYPNPRTHSVHRCGWSPYSVQAVDPKMDDPLSEKSGWQPCGQGQWLRWLTPCSVARASAEKAEGKRASAWGTHCELAFHRFHRVWSWVWFCQWSWELPLFSFQKYNFSNCIFVHRVQLHSYVLLPPTKAEVTLLNRFRGISGNKEVCFALPCHTGSSMFCYAVH
jgi:hypothetical protein